MYFERIVFVTPEAPDLLAAAFFSAFSKQTILPLLHRNECLKIRRSF